MTRPDLDAIRARCEAATAGPWHGAIPACDHDHDADDPAGAIEDPNSAIVANCVAEDGDVYFIMNARTDIPALLAYIDELERDILNERATFESCNRARRHCEDECATLKARTTYTIGETEWANRIAHAEARFVEEYDLRKAAERQIEELKSRIVTLEAMR